jgi:hypothetical protein
MLFGSGFAGSEVRRKVVWNQMNSLQTKCGLTYIETRNTIIMERNGGSKLQPQAPYIVLNSCHQFTILIMRVYQWWCSHDDIS